MSPSPLYLLNPGLEFTVHQQGDKIWYAVQAPHSEQFVRIGRMEYLIASHVDGTRDGQKIIDAIRSIDPTAELTQEKVGATLQWLGKNGWLIDTNASAPPPPSNPPAGKSKFLNPMYIKLPLVSGEHLARIAQRLQFLVSVPALILAGIAVLTAIVAVAGCWEFFSATTTKLFVSDQQLWWLVAWLVLKGWHELGHAVVAQRVGSKIRSAGITLIYLAPIPFVDLSDLWGISNRWHRIYSSAAGMLFELTLASVAAIIAISTTNLTVAYFCCAIATLGTVSTLAFNANPLIRFDGYYIVSDILNRPNLWTHANAAFGNLIKRLIWGANASRTPAPSSIGLILYGASCFAYRVGLMASLAIGVILLWQGVGLLLVLWCGAGTLYTMTLKKAPPPDSASNAPSLPKRYWGFPWLTRGGGGRIAVGCAVLGLLLLCPSPIQPCAPGILTYRDPRLVRAEVEGTLVSVHAQVGDTVAEGDVIATFENRELMLDLALQEVEIVRTEEMIRSKRARGGIAKVQADEARLRSLQEQMEQLQTKRNHLTVKAPQAGMVVTSDLHRQIGRFFVPGEPLCLVAGDRQLEAKLSVDQPTAQRLRDAIGSDLKIRLSDGKLLPGVLDRVAQRGTRILDEPSMAAMYGGPLPVEVNGNPSSEEGLQLVAPRFTTQVRIVDEVNAKPGQMISVRLPGPSMSLFDGLHHWLERKWKQLCYESKVAG